MGWILCQWGGSCGRGTQAIPRARLPSLKTSLELDTGQAYNYAVINKLAIQEDYNKLEGNLSALKTSHDSYVKDCLKAANE